MEWEEDWFLEGERECPLLYSEDLWDHVVWMDDVATFDETTLAQIN